MSRFASAYLIVKPMAGEAREMDFSEVLFES